MTKISDYVKKKESDVNKKNRVNLIFDSQVKGKIKHDEGLLDYKAVKRGYDLMPRKRSPKSAIKKARHNFDKELYNND